MNQNLKLEVILSAINKATAPFKAITKGSSDTAKALKAARDSLRALNAQQNDINGFRKLDKDIAINNNSLAAATTKIKQIKQEMDGVEKPTVAMNRAFNSAVKEANKLKQQHTDLIQKQQQLRTQLTNSGISTTNLAEHQRQLKTNMASVTEQVNKQTIALEKQSELAKRINAITATREKSLQTRDKLAGAGASTAATGVAMGVPILKTIKDYAQFETAMVGVAKQMNDARDKNGNYTQSFYEMANSIKNMSEELPLTSIEIAQLVEGAARMGVEGKKNLLTFTKQAAIMSAAFELPTDQIAEDMGMIANLYKIPIDRIHEFGDAVNYLDDNAQSKGADIINVMKRIAGTATTAGMNFKEAAALGSTFLTLGASEEIAATASNAMINRLSNAPILESSKRYAGGLKMIGLEATKLQQAMSKNATGTILDVLDRIKALPKDKQLEASTRLFGVEYGDDASKLAQNLQEYRRQLQLTKDVQAKGSMAKESSAQNSSLEAQYEMSKNSAFNTSSELGQQLKPALIDILGAIKSVTSGMRDWVREHPVLTGYILKVVAALSIITIGIGGLLIVIASIMGPMILMRYGLGMLGIKGGLLIPVLRGVGMVIGFIGRMLLLNPIGLAVTAIAGSALLIYKYWEPIKGFFIGLWDSITKSFNSFIEPIMKAIIKVKDWLGGGSNNGLALAGAGAPIIKNTPPIRPRGTTPVQSITNAPVINVHPTPGMSEAQLAKLVSQEIEKNNNAAAARSRSTLRDRD